MSDEVQMNMVEILSEELGEKELKIMALEKKLKEQENITKKFMKDTLIKEIKTNDEFIEDGYEIDSELKNLWQDIIEDMNDNDWNEDDKHLELYMYEFTNFNTKVCACMIGIRFRECIECGCTPGEQYLIWKNDCYTCEDCYNVSSDEDTDED